MASVLHSTERMYSVRDSYMGPKTDIFYRCVVHIIFAGLCRRYSWSWWADGPLRLSDTNVNLCQHLLLHLLQVYYTMMYMQLDIQKPHKINVQCIMVILVSTRLDCGAELYKIVIASLCTCRCIFTMLDCCVCIPCSAVVMKLLSCIYDLF